MTVEEYLDSLAADGAMTAEERTALAGILTKNPKVADKAVKGFMLQSDYTRKTQELARDRDRAAQEVTAMNQQLSKALKDLEQGKTTAAQYRARLESIQEEYGVDVSDVLKGQSTAPAAAAVVDQPARTVIDPDILKRLEAAEMNYRLNPEVSALLLDAQVEYANVFGNLNGFRASEVLKYARENNLPIRGNPDTGSMGAFEKLYKVPEKRHEQLVAKITAEAERKANETAQQKIDQMLAGRATGNQTPDQQWSAGSPVLSDSFKQRNQQKIDQRAGVTTPTDQPAPSQSRSAAQNEMQGGAANFVKRFYEIQQGKDPYNLKKGQAA